MIKESIAQAAAIVGKNLADRGIELVATSGDLNTMVAETNLQIPVVTDSSISDAPNMLSVQNEENANLNSYHDAVINGIRDKVYATVDFIKNKAVPTVGELSELLKASHENLVAAADQNITIVEKEIPPLVETVLSGANAPKVEPQISYPNLGLTFDREWFYSGKPQKDAMINQWLESVGGEALQLYFREIYSVPSHPKGWGAHFRKFTSFEMMDVCLVGLLTIGNITRNPPDYLRGVDLGQLDIMRRELTGHMLYHLNRANKQVRNSMRNVVVLKVYTPKHVAPDNRPQSIPQTGYVILVNKTAYKEYISQGGSVNSIRGRALTVDGVTSMKGLLANTIKYIRTERNFSQSVRSITIDKKVTHVKQALKRWFDDTIPLETDGVFAAGIPDNVKTLAKEYCDSLTGRDCNDLDTVAMHAVTRILYALTPANKILSKMDALHTNNEDDPEELLYVAIVSYTTNWLTKSLVGRPISGSLSDGI